MRNILHIIFQTKIVGWVERFLEISSASNTTDELFFCPLFDEEKNAKLPGKILPFHERTRINNPVRLLYLIFKRAYLYSRFCKDNNIDISISHGDSLNLSNIFSKLLFRNKSRIYIFLHNSLSFYSNATSFIYPFLFRTIYPKADKIITVSKEMCRELQKEWYSNVDFIYNPIDTDSIHVLRKEDMGEYRNLFEDNKTVFITAWRLEEVKNIRFLIDVFHEFNTMDRQSRLLILWDGEEKSQLQEHIRLLWDEDIFLLGKQGNIFKFLDKSDYFIYSSLNEWFWRVLIEALACWLPILSHDFKYGAKEIIRNDKDDYSECKEIEIHQNGILVPFMDKKKFIEWMKTMTKISFQKDMIEDGTEIYNIHNFNKKWAELLQ